VEDLEHAPSPEEIGRNRDVAEKIIDRQIRLRKRIMAGLDVEIQEYKQLKKRL
jgi:hypothetical protein